MTTRPSIGQFGDAFLQDRQDAKRRAPEWRFPWLKTYVFTTYVIVLWQACFEAFNWVYWYMQEIVIRRIG